VGRQFPLTGPESEIRTVNCLGVEHVEPEHGRLMLDIMYDLPERQPGQTYTITEDVVVGKTSLFGPEAA